MKWCIKIFHTIETVKNTQQIRFKSQSSRVLLKQRKLVLAITMQLNRVKLKQFGDKFVQKLYEPKDPSSLGIVRVMFGK